jgi:hypothetical protein
MRTAIVEFAAKMSEEAGQPISHQLRNLCDRYLLCEITEEEFYSQIIPESEELSSSRRGAR